MVKRFVILPSDHTWLDIGRTMEEKGMPVEVQGHEVVILSWHLGWIAGGVTYMEFAEAPDEIGPGWIRPDERDPSDRERQRVSEAAALASTIDRYAVRE